MAKVRLSEVANEVRESWCKATDGVPVVGLEHLDPEDIWLRTWQTDGEENTFRKAFRKGQLLFGRRRAYQKKLSIAPCDGICSGDITVIAANEKKVLPELLPFYLRSDRFFDHAMKGSGGSLSPRVKWSHLAGYEFDLPPLKRQRELAKLLWSANDLRGKYKKLITASDEMLKARFVKMFGTETRSRWTIVKIGDIAADVRYGTSIPGESEGAFPYLRMNNITYDGALDVSDLKWITLSGAELEKCIVRKGDVLFNRTNSKELVGKTCCFKYDEPMVIAGYIIRIRLTDKMLPEYLWRYLNLDTSKRMLANMAKGSVGQANINATELKSIRIPLPPIELQREFVELSDVVEQSKTTLRKSIADVDNIITGLING